MIYELLKLSDNISTQKEFANNFNKLNRKYKIQTSKRKLIVKKPSRSISGINSITLVMSPYPHGQSFTCKHNCYYCPNEPAHKDNNWTPQPRSYLYNEPAVRRANQNKFEAYEQMISRMDTLYGNGHPIDKLEIIIEGGTYTEYPIKYLEEFNRDIYYAANTYFEEIKRDKYSLDEEVYINRYSKVHIIGNCIETRPDAFNSDWIYHFRRIGCTRIQLGVQSTHNSILKKINRGHNIECVIVAIEYLKNLAFKIDIHLMPDLPGTTPEMDKESFDFVYNKLYPDQMKIYPCAVVPWTIIKKWYDNNKWTPMSKEDLFNVMNYGVETCPDWIRLPRVIRDIPLEYIEAGNQIMNLRQDLTGNCRDIREREIERHPEYLNQNAKYYYDKYNDKDYFISYESWNKVALFGFIRLRLPKEYSKEYPTLYGKALIRELHVYGFVTPVNEKGKRSQHKGIGKGLLRRAELISFLKGYNGIVVISGEGVKNYYIKRGYYEKDTYMIKEFKSYYYYIISSCLLIVAIFIHIFL
jgi:ELP3 family radical SAM enzyme/protein acetyltransferase